MDYKKHYTLLIEKAKNRILEGYVENHHIIPKAFGGSNDKDNLVSLTAREHFIAHLLLYKMQTSKRKRHQMLTACIMMSGKDKFNSKLYESARKEFSKIHSEKMTKITIFKNPNFWTLERKDKISNNKKLLFSDQENHPMYGKTHTDESKLKNEISNSLNIKIYNENNELMFTSTGNFKKFCDNNNLPFKAFKSSYQHNGELKLYCSFEGRRASSARNKEWQKYKGWYAISNKFGWKKNKLIKL